MSKTPELDKMLAVKEKSQPVGEFLDWLEQSFVICEFGDDSDSDSLFYGWGRLSLSLVISLC